MDRAAELDLYFERVGSGRYSGQFSNEVNLLEQVQAQKTTDQMSGHPTIEALGGFILDDSETSNFHVFASRSPIAGQVLYLTHDGDTRVVFGSLLEFVDAAEQAVAQECFLSELHPVLSPLCEDQRGLVNLIERLCEDDGGEDIAVQLIPSLDLHDTEFLGRLVVSDNFFLAEAIAIEIKKRPRLDLLRIAEQCSAHLHPQAARAGAAAVSAIRAA
ncbi:hypothetical protein [Variovorax sp. LT1R16]|uniref:hypothetical protein n=1 Tax=Variovorax sp. LT1R16 TaxID=3443728 RepID=UPI003F44E8EC